MEYLVFIFPLGYDMHKYACIALNLKKQMHSQYELDTSQFQNLKSSRSATFKDQTMQVDAETLVLAF